VGGWLPVLALGAGLILGFALPIALPALLARYFAIAILAALDSVFGGLRASLEGTFDTLVFITGFFGNMLIAAFLTYIGDRLGVELYYAALFAMGYRIFQNLGIIRRHALKAWLDRHPTAPGA
jgi:small basic protein